MTPKGVQSGGQTVAEFEGIVIVLLNADATTTDFLLEAMDKLIVGAGFIGKGILSATAVAVPQAQPDQT